MSDRTETSALLSGRRKIGKYVRNCKKVQLKRLRTCYVTMYFMSDRTESRPARYCQVAGKYAQLQKGAIEALAHLLCHCVLYFRQDWNPRTIVRSQENRKICAQLQKGAIEALAHLLCHHVLYVRQDWIPSRALLSGRRKIRAIAKRRNWSARALVMSLCTLFQTGLKPAHYCQVPGK